MGAMAGRSHAHNTTNARQPKLAPWRVRGGRWVAAVAMGSCGWLGCTADDAASSAADSGDETAASTAASEDTGADLPLVEMKTTAGNLVLELRPDLAPNTVDNFITYAQAGFYDGADDMGATLIHRVVPGFVIQGGGLTADLSSKQTLPPIAAESGGMMNLRGTVSMALIPGDADSATSQFFINVTDNPELDTGPAFTVFATVALGLDTVDAMSAVDTEAVGALEGVPIDPIIIESLIVL